MTTFFEEKEIIQTTEAKRGDTVLMAFKTVWPAFSLEDREEIRIFLAGEGDRRIAALRVAKKASGDADFGAKEKREVLMKCNQEMDDFVKEKLIRFEKVTDSNNKKVKYSEKQVDKLFDVYEIRSGIIETLKSLSLGNYYNVELEGNSATQATSGQADKS